MVVSESASADFGSLLKAPSHGNKRADFCKSILQHCKAHAGQFGNGGTMTEEEARQIVGEHTTDELRVIAAALSIRQAENTSFRGSEMDADWNDRVGFYCLSLILMRGDQTIPDAKVPGYLRFQVRTAQQAGLGDIADALDKSAPAYEQGHHSHGYSILINAIVPPAASET